MWELGKFYIMYLNGLFVSYGVGVDYGYSIYSLCFDRVLRYDRENIE